MWTLEERCAKSDRRYGLTGISWIIVIIPRSLHQPALTDASQLLTLSRNKLLDDVSTTELGQLVAAAVRASSSVSWQADGPSWICELLCRNQGCNHNLFPSRFTLERPRMSGTNVLSRSVRIYKVHDFENRFKRWIHGVTNAVFSIWSTKRRGGEGR